MRVAVDQRVEITDSLGRRLGTFVIDEQRDRLLLGAVIRGPDYPSVEPLFLEFEEIANDQILSLLDSAQEPIEKLGIRLSSADGARQWPVHDVQIWSDGGMSCRLTEGPRPPDGGTEGTNGTAADSSSLPATPGAV